MKSIAPSESPLYASLTSRHITDEARAFVGSLRKGLENHEKQSGRRSYSRRGDMLIQFEFAVGAFLADLLRAAAHDKADGWVSGPRRLRASQVNELATGRSNR
jgi:hypothetical protein